MKRSIAISMVVLTVLGASMLSQSKAQESSSAELSIDQLAFFAGHWSGDVFGGIGEEAWLAPNAGTMLGSFRHVADGIRIRLAQDIE